MGEDRVISFRDLRPVCPIGAEPASVSLPVVDGPVGQAQLRLEVVQECESLEHRLFGGKGPEVRAFKEFHRKARDASALSRVVVCPVDRSF